jgi:hypothetical protein
MYAGPDYDIINPNEVEWFGMDFANVLQTGETIQSFTVTVTLEKGDDATPGQRAIDAPILIAAKVSQKIGTCVPDNYYIIAYQIVTSQGQTIISYGKVQCNPID